MISELMIIVNPKIIIPELNKTDFSFSLSVILYSVTYLLVAVDIPKSANTIKNKIIAKT